MAARPIHRAVSRPGRTRPQRRQEVQASVTWPVRLHLWKRSQSLEPSLPGSVGLLFPVELSLWHKTEPLTLASVKGMCRLSLSPSSFHQGCASESRGTYFHTLTIRFQPLESPLQQRGVGSGVSRLHWEPIDSTFLPIRPCTGLPVASRGSRVRHQRLIPDCQASGALRTGCDSCIYETLHVQNKAAAREFFVPLSFMHEGTELIWGETLTLCPFIGIQDRAELTLWCPACLLELVA